MKKSRLKPQPIPGLNRKQRRKVLSEMTRKQRRQLKIA